MMDKLLARKDSPDPPKDKEEEDPLMSQLEAITDVIHGHKVSRASLLLVRRENIPALPASDWSVVTRRISPRSRPQRRRASSHAARCRVVRAYARSSALATEVVLRLDLLQLAPTHGIRR
eukprot:1186916-Prorocentrum_minimum.AAC.2